jgi:hypothetical protein
MILFLSDIAANSFHDPEEEREKGQLRAECMRGFPRLVVGVYFWLLSAEKNLSKLLLRVKKRRQNDFCFLLRVAARIYL